MSEALWADEVIAVETIDLTVAAGPPSFDAAERAAIAAGWAERVAANPALWNGAFYLFDRVALEPERGFRGQARPTDFASFLHWRAAAVPDGRFAHVFAVAAVVSRDDRLLLGIMGRQTANPGRAYPPAGSFDDDDRVGDRLDPVTNMRRELAEEVGLDVADLVADPAWWVISSGPRRFALVKRHRSPLTAAEMDERIGRHLASDPHGELSAVRFATFDERLPPGETVPYVNRLLEHLARG